MEMSRLHSPRLRERCGKTKGKNVRTGGWEKWVLWTLELDIAATHVNHRSCGYLHRSNQSEFQHGCLKDSEAPALVEELLVAKCCWGRESHSLLGMWLPVRFPCPGGWRYTHVSRMGRYNWTHVINNNQISRGVNLEGWQDGGHRRIVRKQW